MRASAWEVKKNLNRRGGKKIKFEMGREGS
jgi:hypothetical protein